MHGTNEKATFEARARERNHCFMWAWWLEVPSLVARNPDLQVCCSCDEACDEWSTEKRMAVKVLEALRPEIEDLTQRTLGDGNAKHASASPNQYATLSIPKKCCCSHPQPFSAWPRGALRRLLRSLVEDSPFYFARKFAGNHSSVLLSVLMDVYAGTS